MAEGQGLSARWPSTLPAPRSFPASSPGPPHPSSGSTSPRNMPPSGIRSGCRFGFPNWKASFGRDGFWPPSNCGPRRTLPPLRSPPPPEARKPPAPFNSPGGTWRNWRGIATYRLPPAPPSDSGCSGRLGWRLTPLWPPPAKSGSLACGRIVLDQPAKSCQFSPGKRKTGRGRSLERQPVRVGTSVLGPQFQKPSGTSASGALSLRVV